MRSHYRFVALAATVLAASAAAQQAPAANPIARGEHDLFTPALRGSFDGPADTNALARPSATHFAPVTPVPEPSEWLMLAAGLGIGFVLLRRGARRS
jgi:hypothetical protein